MTLKIFIGFDPREESAYRVCEASMRKHARGALEISRLDMNDLRRHGAYQRPHQIRDGRLWDVISDAPMSTSFGLTRFLVPHLSGYQGWALYCDCDFLWRADVADLFALAEDRYAVMVVKHYYIAKEGDKMCGQINRAYTRKNWTSLMLLNCSHPANAALTTAAVNTWQRDALHKLTWLDDADIGALPSEWNWIEHEPRAVHFTAGTPDLEGYEGVAYADEYRSYL